MKDATRLQPVIRAAWLSTALALVAAPLSVSGAPGMGSKAHGDRGHETGSGHGKATGARADGGGGRSKAHAVHWGYAGAVGPARWGGLSPKWRVCASGKRQSPVDINEPATTELYELGFRYGPVPLRVVNNGHTVKVDYGTRSAHAVTIGGKEFPINTAPSYESELYLGDAPYGLLQFHLHTPSEHTVSGKTYPMELHLVHRNAEGNLAVVGLLFENGSPNRTIQQLLDHVSTQTNHETFVKNVNIDAGDLLPKDKAVYHYSGSLTTPPCSENVNWFVMRTPVQASPAQIAELARIMGSNARPVQSANWRRVLSSR